MGLNMVVKTGYGYQSLRQIDLRIISELLLSSINIYIYIRCQCGLSTGRIISTGTNISTSLKPVTVIKCRNLV